MSFGPDELFKLLPEDFRIRDAALGARLKALADSQSSRGDAEYGPLKSLLSLFAREIRFIEEDIDQLGDDFAIETCSDEVLPLIADLVGVRRYRGIARTELKAASADSLRARTANAIYNRQAKGTLLALQQAAMDACGWPILAVEHGRMIAETFSIRLPDAVQNGTFSTRMSFNGPLGGFAGKLARTPEIGRKVGRARRWNYPNIGLHVYPHVPCRLTGIDLTPAGGREGCFFLHRLGCDAQIWSWPATRVRADEAMTLRHVCLPLTRRELKAAFNAYYGLGKSLCLFENGEIFPRVAGQSLRICNLSDRPGPEPGGADQPWARKPGENEILLDPELGRVRVGTAIAGTITANVCYGRMDVIGGGEVPLNSLPNFKDFTRLSETSLVAQVTALTDAGEPVHLLAERSLTVPAEGTITVKEGESFQVNADAGAWPLFKTGGGLKIFAEKGASIEISGIQLCGGPLTIAGAPALVVIRDTTFVPGLELSEEGRPLFSGVAGLRLLCPGANVVMERCISSPIEAGEYVTLTLSDCIVDAGETHSRAIFCNTPERDGFLFACYNSTVIGQVHVGQFQEASDRRPEDMGLLGSPTSNSIVFAVPGQNGIAAIDAAQRQFGCIRHSALPASSRTCRTYRCGQSTRLIFKSRNYLDADYLWIDPLRRPADQNVAEGAETAGVFHRLRPAARTANIFEASSDFLRLGYRSGPIF